MDIRAFINLLRSNKASLTNKQFATLKGQALSGDIEGARKGIDTLIKRHRALSVV